MTKPWKEFRQEIIRLYIQEGRTLHDVREIMHQRHGFEASIRSYRQHFDDWGVGKYNCKKRQHRRRSISDMDPSPPRTPMLHPTVGKGSHLFPGHSQVENGFAIRRHSEDDYRHVKMEPQHAPRGPRLSLPTLSGPPVSDHFFNSSSRWHPQRSVSTLEPNSWHSDGRRSMTWGGSDGSHHTPHIPSLDNRAVGVSSSYAQMVHRPPVLDHVEWNMHRIEPSHYTNEGTGIHGTRSSHSSQLSSRDAMGLAAFSMHRHGETLLGKDQRWERVNM